MIVLPNSEPIAVIDIGSNSMRLVIYDRLTRSPMKLLDEQLYPYLGRDISSAGTLSIEGVDEALKGLQRFRLMSEALGVKDISVVATAAIREASDGQDFLTKAKAICGQNVMVISGEEEGRLSALGVLSGIPNAVGLVGDLGGGSLELACINKGQIGDRVTLPLGPFRLMEIGDYREKRPALMAFVDKHLETVEWLSSISGQNFYAVGGNWRAIAKVKIWQDNYPLRILHNYTLSGKQGTEFSGFLSGLSQSSFQNTDIKKKRLKLVPYAALVMERVLKFIKPDKLVFSAYGLREGILFDRLNYEEQARDPLIAACQYIVREDQRLHNLENLVAWSANLFKDESPEDQRLRIAVTLISDIGWAEHPDHRAEIAYERTLFLQAGGITHSQRAFIALAVLIRYNGVIDKPEEEARVKAALRLLTQDEIDLATRLGLLLRFVYTLTGGAMGLLNKTALQVQGQDLVFSMAENISLLLAESIEKRFEALAKSMSLKPILASF